MMMMMMMMIKTMQMMIWKNNHLFRSKSFSSVIFVSLFFVEALLSYLVLFPM